MQLKEAIKIHNENIDLILQDFANNVEDFKLSIQKENIALSMKRKR
jgi:hypothetical protein